MNLKDENNSSHGGVRGNSLGTSPKAHTNMYSHHRISQGQLEDYKNRSSLPLLGLFFLHPSPSYHLDPLDPPQTSFRSSTDTFLSLHRPSRSLHRPSRSLHRPSRSLHRPSRSLHRSSGTFHRSFRSPTDHSDPPQIIQILRRGPSDPPQTSFR